jgi:ABC-type transport system involved in multi-copper enzyme maturation permease subunit
MTTITPYRSPAPAGRGGFRQLLHAEWTKFRTVRGWLVGMIVAILVTAGIGLFVAEGGATATCQQQGGPPQSGNACHHGYTLGPGGEPVNDQFYFVRQPLAGDGSITVRMTSLTGLLPTGNIGGGLSTRPGLVPWAKAGIIIKDGTTQGSAYAAMMVTGANGVRMQWDYTGDTAGLPGNVSASSPRWLRLTRDGDTLTGYDSADGTHWTQVGTVTLSGLPSTVQAGLFATSPTYLSATQGFHSRSISGGPSQVTAVLDHVSLSGAWPSGTWTGGYIGGGAAAVAKGLGGYHQASGRFTVRGSGDISPVIGGPLGGSSGPPELTTTDYLTGAFLGLIAVAAVATMFMTAEYRRGLIRTTLAATPVRGRVLAAKAIVIGSVAFLAGLVAAVCAAIIDTDLADHRGDFVFPVSFPTELRVIGGAAALVAVAAILALAIATMVRRSAAAITIVIVTVVVPYFLSVTGAVPTGVANWLLRITPAAAFAVQQSTPAYHQVQAPYSPGTGFFPLDPWAGFAVLCAWTAVALVVAAYLLKRRDA